MKKLFLSLALLGAGVAYGAGYVAQYSSAYDGPMVYPPPEAGFPRVIIVYDLQHGNIYKVFGPFKNWTQEKYWLNNNPQFWSCNPNGRQICKSNYMTQHLYTPNLSELVE